MWVLKYSAGWGVFGLLVSGILNSRRARLFSPHCWARRTTRIAAALFRGHGRSLSTIGAQHACRAQLWIAIFGFIGNYWYTHYFYCVLRAKYTMPSWRFNDVPIAMFCATHFYFTSYHVFANLPLRYVRTAFEAGFRRTVLEVALVLAMSYATAFMETLTISNYPYYDFETRDMAYTVGSAFYGLYFVVSFPVYFSLDEPGKVAGRHRSAYPLRYGGVCLASGMLVLILHDLAPRRGDAIPLGDKLFEVTFG